MILKKILLPAVVIAMVVSSCNAQEKSKTNMKTEKDSISYSLGVSIANNLKQGNLDDVNIDVMAQGMKDFFANKPAMTVQACEGAIQTYMSGKEKAKGSENEAKGQAFLAANQKKEGVTTTASGLQYKVIKMGTGAKPTLNDKITAHYHGTLIDGTVFDSSVDRGQPASFPVSGVIPGWTEALQLMPVGSKWTLYLPSNLAYGEKGAGGKIGPNSALVFDVELISIDK
jgi:FKBP-type peptidyl-prolyl cis-trans isomerase FklB